MTSQAAAVSVGFNFIHAAATILLPYSCCCDTADTTKHGWA